MRWPWQRRSDQRADPLGQGLWRHTHDRFRRAVDRYHQMLEAVRSAEGRNVDADTHAALEAAGSELAAALDRVHELCVRAQSVAPTEGLDIPRGWSDFQRALSRAGTMAAQAAEGVALVRVACRSGDRTQASAAVGTVQRAVRDVVQLIDNASAAAESATGTERGRTSPEG